jgi:hypothetical protein
MPDVDDPDTTGTDDAPTSPPNGDGDGDGAGGDEGDGDASAPVDPVDGTPSDSTTGPITPATAPNLSASVFDGVYADGVPVGAILRTFRSVTGGGANAYGVSDAGWDGFGGYATPSAAPRDVQNSYAYARVRDILRTHGGDVSLVPVVWYAGFLPPVEQWDQSPEGTELTLRQLQSLWLEAFDLAVREGAPPVLGQDESELIPSIAFPVLGPTSFVHDWHFARDGGTRLHEGLDLMGTSGQPLLAAFDGTVVRIVGTNQGISGVSIEIARADGVRAVYRHVNNDTPGTTDNSAHPAFRTIADLEAGDMVKAGQVIAFMGDTGNATGNPHLHFELRTPDRVSIDPYPAVLRAQQLQQCTIGIGPWSTVFDRADAVPPNEDSPAPFLVEGPDGARWTVSVEGHVTAMGAGAMITPARGGCDAVVDDEVRYGSHAAGLALANLPEGWGVGDGTGEPAELAFEPTGDVSDLSRDLVVPFGDRNDPGYTLVEPFDESNTLLDPEGNPV